VRVGNVLEMDGALLKVSKRQHVKPGKGGAFVQLELKDIKSSTKRNLRLRAADSVEQAQFENPESYRILYREKNILSLMHDETYEQIEMDEEVSACLDGTNSIHEVQHSLVLCALHQVVNEEQRQYLQDDIVLKIQTYEGKPLLVEVPKVRRQQRKSPDTLFHRP